VFEDDFDVFMGILCVSFEDMFKELKSRLKNQRENESAVRRREDEEEAHEMLQA